MFKLEIDTGNAAFDDDNGGAGAEIARILRKLADRVESDGYMSGTVSDINGNRVGTWSREG